MRDTILEALSSGDWIGKQDIFPDDLEGNAPNDWNKIRKELIDSKTIETQGKKTKQTYRLIKKAKK